MIPWSDHHNRNYCPKLHLNEHQQFEEQYFLTFEQFQDCLTGNNKLELGNYPNNKKSGVLHKNTNYLNIKDARQSQDIVSDKAINNIKTVKIPKYGNKLDLNIGQRGSNISDNNNINKKHTSKAKYAKKITKRKSKQSKNKNNQQSHKFKSEQKLIEIEGKRNIGGVRNSYFAEEKKGEDCLLI